MSRGLPSRLFGALVIAFIVAALPAQALEPVFSRGGAALRGYDTVAYFTAGEPTKGSRKITHDWMGTTWRFASAENRDLFAANPEKYAPRYGGYCAWAAAQGYTASTDPDAWKIVDGKLYLNYSSRVQRTWERDVPGNITKADANWPGIRNEG